MTQAAMSANLGGQPAEDGTLILDPGDPMPTARQFLATYHRNATFSAPTLADYRGTLYRWIGHQWIEHDLACLKSELFHRLEPAERWVGSGENARLEPFRPKPRNVADVVEALKAQTVVDGAVDVPAWINASDKEVLAIDPRELLPVGNGLLHLGCEDLIDPLPMLFNFAGTPVPYLANARPPQRWLAFLQSIFGEAANPYQEIQALQELFGLALSGDLSHHKVFLIVGPPRSGKGTIARVLRQLVGENNYAGPTLAALSQNFGLQSLIGKSVACVSDARLSGRAGHAIITERLLSISGEDTLSVPRKHQSDWVGKLAARFILMSNELPQLRDVSGALASRFIVWQLHQSFLGREDKALGAKLSAELPGILKWTIAGLKSLRDRGHLLQPPSGEDALIEMGEMGSPVKTFIDAVCFVSPDRQCEAAALYHRFKRWCEEDANLPATDRATFGRDLAAAVPGVRKARIGSDGNRTQVYKGVGLC